MKRILLFLLCLATFYNVQAQNTAYANRMQYIFGNINKSKVTTGYLKEFGVRFANIEVCNGSLSTNNYVTLKEWNNLYNSLYSMRVGTVAQNMIAPSVVNTNLKTAQSNSNDILIAVQHFNYQQYKTNAHTNGDVIITNDKIYDVTGRNPYDSKTLFAITPLKQNLQGSNFNFKLPSNLIYSNVGVTISQITVDFNNGQGYQNIAVNEVKNISYTTGGEKIIKVKFQYTNGSIVESQSKIWVDYINSIPSAQARFNGFGSDMFWVNHAVPGNNWNGSAATGLVTIELAPGHTQLTKPLIIIEGFDPENSFNYLDLINDDGPGGLNIQISQTGQPFLTLNQAIEDEDYDLVFINFVNSTDYIQRNAYMVEEVIRQINQLKVGNEKNVVLGMSMGGLVGRYALRHMETSGETHETKLYISHDSPHQGANVPLAAQALVRHLVGEQISLPVFFSLFSVPIADLEDNVDGLSDGFALLQSPAAQQMLIYQLQGTGAGISINNSTLNSSFLNEYKNMGYPIQDNIRNIAIANGSECGNPLNFNPYADIVNANIQVDLPFFLTNIALAITNGISINPIKVITSVLSTNTDLKAQFTLKALPSLQSKQIYKGRIYIKKTILFVINVNEPLINEKTLNSSSTMLALDNANGGIYDIENFAELPTEFEDYVFQRRFNFIPAYSSLDVGSGNATIVPSDLTKKYNPQSPPSAPKNVPFNNFFTNSITSEAHIQFTLNNGFWLRNEISGTPQIFSCSYACDDKVNNISGTNLICNSNSATFTAPAGGTFYNWQIIDGSHLIASSIGSNTQNFTITTLSTGYGRVKLQVTMGDDPNNTGNGRCGNAVFIINIWVGKPYVFGANPNPNELEYFVDGTFCPIESTTLCAGNYSEDNSRTICVAGLDSNSQWEIVKLSGYFSYSHYNGMITINPSVPGALSFKVRVSNSCGISDWKTFTYNAINCNSNIALRSTESSTYIVYPNPSKDIVNIDLRDSNNQPEITAKISGELFDLMGFSKARVEIINNKAIFSVTDIPKGIYVLKIYINDEVESHQIAVE
ncbi:T9SS type A sorting domain-containing protein [Flavobacterium dankookense]|uniref:Putative secreted protein (Por secretion system target) n=1 Tax=Flavobacterium dankookense TaxID=706186 RepID=A0A4R6QDS9_9FLAO|nr:T9SS type A sorting domain-containing protein [Flavobacterium dankookense]TDP60357.1 putative secreted protein (Por secretion system target) [Flavobacterium dankookense]